MDDGWMDLSLMSPIKCPSSAVMDNDGNGSPPRRKSWVRFGGDDNSCASASLNISTISELNVSHVSLEATAGTSNNSSFIENGEEGPDYLAKISDLQLQIQKLNEDNVALRARVCQAQEENFNLLQSQVDDLDHKDNVIKGLTERVKRLEREVHDKSGLISALEDRITIMTNRNSRLENECSAYGKERKELVVENEELKNEVQRTQQLLSSCEDSLTKFKSSQIAAQLEFFKKEKWLNERNDILLSQLQQMEEKLECLSQEKAELEGRLVLFKTDDHGNDSISRRSQLSSSGIHSQSFDLDISSDDIQAELLAADCFSPSFRSLSIMNQSSMYPEKFDAATQSEFGDVTSIVQLDALKMMLTEVYATAMELAYTLTSVHSDLSLKRDVDRPLEDQTTNGGEKLQNGSKNGHPTSNNGDGINGNGTGDAGDFGAQSVNSVVKQIHEELAEFKEQLKKSQELFTVLRINSSQSFSKSCPGLALDSGFDADGSTTSKWVSSATQTDSPVIETPVLAQKLCLASVSSQNGLSQSAHHSHYTIQSGGLSHFEPNDSIDNPNFDKLSDDGSVRVRDDLSMVLELSELEAETSPGTAHRTMSFDKGSIGNNRPRLQRMANAKEDEELQNSQNGKKDGGNHHHRQLLNVDDIQSDNDYVSATSSQAESVYLSLERPLKVTTAGSVNSNNKTDGDRSSGGFRSCGSSSVKSGGGSRLNGNEYHRHIDSDSASLVSEGNTTFGSPLSSPSSPYWTPSQGSSSQETLTPLDGDRTPVNERAGLEDEHRSSSEIYLSPDRSSSRSASLGASPHMKHPGRILESDIPAMMQLTRDCVARATDPDAKCLSTKEWRILRKDMDLNDKEVYRKAFAQEEGNEDDGVVGMDGGSIPSTSAYAFALDEEAEMYLECLPTLAESLFKALDVIREKKEDPSQSDLEDLERKFNHMAEVFQTEHTNLDQRRCTISKELEESQANLKSISHQLKDCHSTLKKCSSSAESIPLSDLLEVMKTLASITDEFELYSSSVCRNARRMGMMDVQNRLHKMLDVMILYVHIIRAKFRKLETDYKGLHTEFTRASDLMKDKGIPFRSNHPIDSIQKHNNNNEPLWDDAEMENSNSDKCDEGESEPEKIVWHLLAPKKSSAGHTRGKERPVLKEKQSSGNLFVRWLTEGCEVLRRELFWPWNLEQTIKGLKQGFSVMLMILGLFVFLRGFLPSVSAIDDGCITNPSFFKNVKNYFSHCGQLSHDDTPVI